MKILKAAMLLFISLVLCAQGTVFARTPQQIRSDLNKDIIFVGGKDCSISTSGVTVNPSEAEAANAKIVIGIAQSLNLGQQGALIGLMTSLTESNLKNYANDGSYVDEDENYSGTRLGEISQSLPHDAVGNDHDSVGIMQQRVTGSWAQMGASYDNLNNTEVIKRLMTPAFAAEAFYKVLLAVPNWQSMDPGVAAQTVQRSAFPDRYNENRPRAQSLIDELWASSQPIALPFPIEGSPTAAAGSGGLCISGGSAAILEKIKEFAWADYRDVGKSNAMEKKPKYQEAVNRSSYKGDCDGVDCGAFVTIVMRESGADPAYNTNPEGSTTQQLAYLRRAAAAGKYTKVTDKAKLQAGDIAIRDKDDPIRNRGGHTFFFVGTAIKQDADGKPWTGGQAASSSQCERAPMASGMDTFEDYEWYHLN